MLHRSHLYGVMGEFATPEDLIHAVEKIREAGYRQVNAYSPFPVEGLSEALGLKRNMVPVICLLGGLTGGVGGFFFQYWAAAITYPLNIGGRPLNSWPAFIPVTFELTILGASLAAVLGMLAGPEQTAPAAPSGFQRGSFYARVVGPFFCLHRVEGSEIPSGAMHTPPPGCSRAPYHRGVR